MKYVKNTKRCDASSALSYFCRWQATTEVETLTEQPAGPALHWAARAQEKRVGRLLTHLADAVTVTKQALGSNWEWQTHCKLWATPQILLRTPLSSGQDETNPCKGKIDAVREVADRCKYPGCETQVLAGTGVAEGDEKTEKEIRKLVMEEPAPSDTNFVEEMTIARKTLKDKSDQDHCENGDETPQNEQDGSSTKSIWPEELTRRNDRGRRRRSRMVTRMDTAVGTCRHHDQRGRSVGARIAGTAATTGTSSATQTGNGGGTSYQREKCEIPPPTNGAFVETITFEPLGRPGKEGLQVVEAMAADAATMRGDRTAAPAAGRGVRHALEYTLFTGVGENPEKGTQWATRMSNSRDERRRATTDCLQAKRLRDLLGEATPRVSTQLWERSFCVFSLVRSSDQFLIFSVHSGCAKLSHTCLIYPFR